jgi:hypothetical protein
LYVRRRRRRCARVFERTGFDWRGKWLRLSRPAGTLAAEDSLGWRRTLPSDPAPVTAEGAENQYRDARDDGEDGDRSADSTEQAEEGPVVLVDHSGERRARHRSCADIKERQRIKASRRSAADVAGRGVHGNVSLERAIGAGSRPRLKGIVKPVHDRTLSTAAAMCTA